MTPRQERTPGAVLQRCRRAIDAPSGRRLVLVLDLLVLVTAIGPFVLWEQFGPARFDELDLGAVPVVAEEPLPTVGPGTIPDVGDRATMPPRSSPTPTPDAWDPSELPFALAPTTTVTLVFSVGSRGLTQEEASRLRVDDLELRGADGLTDTIMLLLADRATRRVALLSVPRDLWLHHRGHRINASFNRRGMQAFVDDVSRATGLPVHHVVQLNFAAFAELVDALGGVAVPSSRSLADLASVLFVPEAGCWMLDGRAALAWVRSRATLTRSDDGTWDGDSSASDFGRMERQRALLGAIWDQVRTPASIGRVPALVGAARRGLVVDDTLGLQEVRDLAAAFADLSAGRVEGYTLPTVGRRIGRAAAQVPDVDAATTVLTRLRAWPPDDGVDPAVAPPPAALPVDAGCTPAVARALPDPREPLGVIAGGGDPMPVLPTEPVPAPSGTG